jgi:hypothetical protein
MRYAVIYGGIAGAVAIAIISTTLAFDLQSNHSSVWFGYLVMLAALSLIFVGVKRYRDVECGGVIGFRRALGLGVGTAAIAGLFYAIGWEVFVAASGYDFIADYSASMVAGMRAEGASAAAMQAKVAELQEMASMYNNPLIRMPMIFIEIFPVGLLVALATAAILRNPGVLPAER